MDYWKFAPGEGAKYWEEMFKDGIASIGFGLDFPIKDKTDEELEKLLKGKKFSQKRITAINNFKNVKKGDILFAFEGRKTLLGYGEILKNDCCFEEKKINHGNYISVKWTRLDKPLETRKFVGMDTFLNMNDRKKEILDLINNPNSNPVDGKNMTNTLNRILYGPPGTGKTYNSVIEALKILEGEKYINNEYTDQKSRFDKFKRKGQIEFVTFHQSFSYEDFVEGIRAITSDEGKISYVVEDGVFKALANKAKNDPNNPYVLIIDEINRGNISRIFGELITLIEPSKRLGSIEAIIVKLPYSKNQDFGVPNNLYIIGTMNTADRSLALMDTALRRRFDFIEMMPNLDLLTDLSVDEVNIKQMLEKINMRIEALYDREHTIGHAFFMELNDKSIIKDLENIFKNKILPLLEEYFFEDWEKISKVLGNSGIYEKQDFINLGFEYSGSTFRKNAAALEQPNTYINIYKNPTNTQ